MRNLFVHIALLFFLEATLCAAPAENQWEKAPCYSFVPVNPATQYGAEIVRKHNMDKQVRESGTVKILKSEKNLSFRFECVDSDVVAQSPKDQGFLFVQGDAVEIFLKPEGVPFYWEIYADVSNKKSCIFIPSRGRLGLPKNREIPDFLPTVETQIDGTLNDSSDKDKGFILTVSIPLSALLQRTLADNTSWSFCVVRYNYSVYLPIWERTVYPALSGEPHCYEEFLSLPVSITPIEP
ncbi:MAG: hypothetical protein PHS41_07860 [Victivallaceae bacterium]|nr:hypothetical protein [Victivallaceae bacterium]